MRSDERIRSRANENERDREKTKRKGTGDISTKVPLRRSGYAKSSLPVLLEDERPFEIDYEAEFSQSGSLAKSA